MMHLPTHPRTGLLALGIVGGRPVWPVLGAAEDDGAAAQAAAAEKAAADAATTAAKGSGPAFPADTPVAEMTTEQQAAYWKHQARKHEDTVKKRGDYDDLKRKAAEHDRLVEASRTEHEREVQKARDEAKAEARAESAPRLVTAEFRAAAKGRIDPERLTSLLEPLDLKRFLDGDGEVDTDKVSKYVDGIAPATGSQQQRRGPSAHGQGRGHQNDGKPSVASGREAYAARHPKRSTT